MIVTFTAPCPECQQPATWTQTPKGTGNAAPEIRCRHCHPMRLPVIHL